MESQFPAPTSPSSDEALKSLDLVADTRAGLADRIITPWWYHPGLSLIISAGVAAVAVFVATIVFGRRADAAIRAKLRERRTAPQDA